MHYKMSQWAVVSYPIVPLSNLSAEDGETVKIGAGDVVLIAVCVLQ